MAFFLPGDAADIYVRVRDREFYSDARDRVEALRVRYEPLCRDPDFCRDAMQHFNARVWQMYIACVLLDHGHVLEPSGGDAPDLKIRQPDGSVLWIEVTTAEAGEGPNRAKRIYQSDPSIGSAMFQLDERKMILRYQNAIRKKAIHRDEFIERGAIAVADPYVIAINAADIDDAVLDDGLPNIVRAVYPVGELHFSYRVRTDYSDPSEEFDPGGHWVRPITPSVKTPKGIDAPTTGFADGALAGVSALIFSPEAIWNAPQQIGRECISVYNATAATPIVNETFKFGESWHGDGANLHKREWRPIADGDSDDGDVL